MHRPFVASLAAQTDLPWRHQVKISPSQTCRLADPRAAIVEKEQQRVVAPALVGPSIGGVDDGPDVGGFKVAGGSKSRPLRWQRQHPCVLLKLMAAKSA